MNRKSTTASLLLNYFGHFVYSTCTALSIHCCANMT